MRAHNVIALVLVAALVAPGVAAAAPGDKAICSAEAAQKAPDVSGRYVVWEDERWGYDDLWTYDLGTGEEQRLTDAPYRQGNAAISGSSVIAEDFRNGVTTNLFSYGVQSLADTAVSMTGLYDRYEPAIFGSRIAWKDGRADFNVYFGSLDGSVPDTPVTKDGYEQHSPAISNTWVVWVDERLSAGANGDIYGHKFSTGTQQPICEDPAIQGHPAISDPWVVWDDYRNDDYDIYAFNLTTQTESEICTQAGAQVYPDVDGRWVVWADSRNGDYDIYAYDLVNAVESAVCTATGDQTMPAVAGDWVVWQDGRDGNQSDIYGTSLVPAADLVADGVSGPGSAGVGGPVAVQAQIGNHGDADAAASTLGVYLSTDAAIDRSDWRVGTASVPGIAEGATVTVNAAATVPADLAAGSYRLGVIADDPGALYEKDEADNAAVGGTVNVSLPANDAFSAARSISGIRGSLSGALSVGATKQAGEPKHGGSAGGASIWFKWTAPSSGRTTIDLEGSSFDTVLGIYKGTNVASLSKVTSNDDVGTRLQSSATFSATKGSTYYIAVDGFGGAEGSVTMHWTHRATLTTPSTPSRVGKRVTFTTTGYLKPRHTRGTYAVTLYYERKESGAWKRRKTLSVKISDYSSYSRYSARTSLPYTGSWRVRARHSDTSHAETFSGYRYFTVR